ncbi:GNAT family N-acetyltransferase [Clostridium sp. YIM B02515]|uniref:GNAT family N-acetyltransferase n=1 Tax=Clostridium rhizosphaerae TaxID=2803861 RepID=A0ABS1TBV4_9CLOT|nr:GNAT family N-acetyltransferase [Clostridium rhizosphaerae]MBL4936843.1 GNAT family N-acetyltransferase [Clostridium rhizosphaerae]
MERLLLKPRTLEHVKIFWEKSQDQEIERMFPFNKGTLNDAIKLYEETLKPDAKSFGKVINIDNKYIGDVWCYGIDEAAEKQAFVSIIIFDKTYWGKGIGKDALKQFSKLVFERYAVSRLCAFTYKDNKRSIATLESAGFKKLEEFKENGIISCYYELLEL